MNRNMSYEVIRHVGPRNELRHFGIKGMKWGVRRYQNKDGTLTAEGRNRYGDDISKRSVRSVKKQVQAGFASNKIDTSSINKKVTSELDKTKEGKAKKNADNFLEEIFKQAEAQGISRDKVVFDGNTAQQYNEIQSAYISRLKQIGQKHADEYASVALKSLGYKDTQSGREWLKKHNFMDW